MTFSDWFPWILACLLALVLLGTVVSRWWQGARERRAQRKRQKRALRGERKVEGLLKRHGYRVVDRQVEQRYQIQVDGEPRTVTVRCDVLAERDGARFVVEVKTGRQATSLGCAETRRQLLEYAVAYDVDGVILADMEARQLIDVAFPRISD